MDPVEKFGWVLVDGSNQRCCHFAVSFSIEAVEPRKNLYIDIPLAGFRMSVHHRWCERFSVQTRGENLQISDECSQVAMIGSGEGIDSRLLKFNPFLPKDPSRNSTQSLIVGTNKIDLQEVLREAVSRVSPRGVSTPQTHLFIAGKNDGLLGLVKEA